MKGFDCRIMAFRSLNECPHCDGSRIKRNGWEHRHQKRYCLDCHKSFSSRGGTILSSSKLWPSQIRKMESLLSDGAMFHQTAHQAGVSVQTACLRNRKLQPLGKSQKDTVLSGKIEADHTYIGVPTKQRSRESGRVPSANLRHFGKAFEGSEETAVNPKDPQAHGMLNTVNRACCQIRKLFRIHPQNIEKYLDEYAIKAENYDEKSYPEYIRNIDRSIFLSGKAFRRRDVSGNPQQ